MARLLITGGAGFIGTNFTDYWLNHHPSDHVVVLDALTYAGNAQNICHLEARHDFRFVKGDITNGELVSNLLREESLDTVVHFAAESHVDRSILAPGAFVHTNVLGTQVLLEASREFWLEERKNPDHRFHHISTDEVFGSLGPKDPAFTEDTAYAPNSPYAASKAGSDHLVRAYHKTYGLNVTTSNCSNNYGPYQFPEKLIPLTLCNALTGKDLPVYGDGSNIRDWLYVEDHCRGIELVLEKGKIGETYNLGGANEIPNIDIVNTICRQLDAKFKQDPNLSKRFPNCPATRGKTTASLITFVTDRPGHDWRYAIKPDKSEKELGFEAKENFETGLDKTIQWMLDNEDWWRAVLDGSYRNL